MDMGQTRCFKKVSREVMDMSLFDLFLQYFSLPGGRYWVGNLLTNVVVTYFHIQNPWLILVLGIVLI